MNFNIATKNYILLPREKEFLNRKLAFLERVLKKTKGNPTLDLEVEELSRPTEDGYRFKVGATFTYYDKHIRIEDLHHDLRSALDSLCSDLKLQILKNNKKHKTIVMRSAFKNKYSFLNKFLNRHKKDTLYPDDLI